MKVHEIITGRIIAALERGTAPWRRPWSGGAAGVPRNLASERPYRGVNVLLLASSGHASPWWVTFRQAQQLGGSVRRGEKGLPVVFWRWPDREADPGDSADAPNRRHAPVLRYYTVFNAAEQCDGLDLPEAPTGADFVPIEGARRIVEGMPDPPRIVDGPAPCYLPASDTVHLPPPERFTPPEEYYCAAFHELAHATGAERRLARKGVTDPAGFGSHAYSREELVAEIAAAFLCAHAGIEQQTLENSAAYLAGGLEVLRGDSRLVVEASAAAQKATDWILDRRQVESADEVAP